VWFNTRSRIRGCRGCGACSQQQPHVAKIAEIGGRWFEVGDVVTGHRAAAQDRSRRPDRIDPEPPPDKEKFLGGYRRYRCNLPSRRGSCAGHQLIDDAAFHAGRFGFSGMTVNGEGEWRGVKSREMKLVVKPSDRRPPAANRCSWLWLQACARHRRCLRPPSQTQRRGPRACVERSCWLAPCHSRLTTRTAVHLPAQPEVFGGPHQAAGLPSVLGARLDLGRR